MSEAQYDVFLSHSSRDKPIVRELAERLRSDGLRVWFDEWEIRAGDSVPAKINEGILRSRVLVLGMSANAFGSDWAQLESQTFLFRDPLNKERRFMPLRFDDAPIESSLVRFRHLSWNLKDREQEYPKLLEACRVPKPDTRSASGGIDLLPMGDRLPECTLSIGHTGSIRSVAFSPDEKLALSGSDDGVLRLWEVESGRVLRAYEGHLGIVRSVSFSPDSRRVLSGGDDCSLRLWEAANGRVLRTFEGHTGIIWSASFSPDGHRILSSSGDRSLRLWEAASGRVLRTFEGHAGIVWSASFSPDGRRFLSGGDDLILRLWDAESGRVLRTFEGSTSPVLSVAISPDGRQVLSGSVDRTLRLWDVESGQAVRTFEGHAGAVFSVSFSSDGRQVLSGGGDRTLRLWETQSGRTVRTFEGHTSFVGSVAFSPDGRRLLSGSDDRTLRLWDAESGQVLWTYAGHAGSVSCISLTSDGRRILSGGTDRTLRLWDSRSGQELRTLEGRTDAVPSVTFSPDGRWILSSGEDRTLRLWDADSGRLARTFGGHGGAICSVTFSPDGLGLLSGSDDGTLRLWDAESGRAVRTFKGHSGPVLSVSFSPDGRLILSGGDDRTVRLWDRESGRAMRTFEAHTKLVRCVSFSPDGRRFLSGSEDCTVRLWDADGRTVRTFEGHAGSIRSVSFSPDCRQILSGGADGTLWLWDAESVRALETFEGHTSSVLSVSFSPDGRLVRSAAANGVVRFWSLVSEGSAIAELPIEERRSDNLENGIQYANAKVLLVGDSGVGKTGLANYLALGEKDVERIMSTDGAWATQWTVPHSLSSAAVDREIWLWDFAGQVDYRLVHQLFMNDTAAAVLMFNPQAENPIDGLGQWEVDLRKGAQKPFAKLLVAGRVDRGGLVVSAANMERFMAQRGFTGELHLTSAKTGDGCDKLRDAIVAAIDWDALPITTSSVLYRRIKEGVLRLRDSGTVLIRLAELNQRLELSLEGMTFTLAELETALGHLSGPGMIQRLDFGGFYLMRPEVLSRYAAALVRKVRRHPQELGCIREEDLLAGDLDYQDFERLPADEEVVVLRALLELAVKRAWCLRQGSDHGVLLTFPSYFRRERPEMPAHPSVLASYRFTGPADDIYATLVVRLHHTKLLEATNLWRDAADFKTQAGAALGILLEREGEGRQRLDAWFDSQVSNDSRIVFERYVFDHLKEHAQEVRRLRHYCCNNADCEGFGRPLAADRAAIDKALAPGGKGKVFCLECGRPIRLHDLIEEKFESPEVKAEVRQAQADGQEKIDNESRELILVGHAFSIVAEAGQIYRGYTNSDHGIDGEIEFKNDRGEASGKRLYLQLKSGDSYLTKRKRDDAEVFSIKNPRWAEYWRNQAYTVMLVIRTSDEAIRWMDVTDYLKRESDDGREEVKQIVFDGERFDIASVGRWRQRLLSGKG